MRFVLSERAVSAVIPGMTSRAEVDMNVAYSDGAAFPAALKAEVAAHTWVRNCYWETLIRLQGQQRIGVVEGDIETSLDADRLQGLGAQISLVNTANGFGGECHLDATMVRSALGRASLRRTSVSLGGVDDPYAVLQMPSQPDKELTNSQDRPRHRRLVHLADQPHN